MNQNRRKFLKFLLIGFGFFLVWRFFPLNFLFSQKKEIKFGNFRAIESGEKLVFFNEKGEKFFSLNKKGELEIGD